MKPMRINNKPQTLNAGAAVPRRMASSINRERGAPVPLGPLPRKTGSRGEIVTLPGRDSTAPLSPTPWSLSPWLSRQRGILHENSSRWHCGHHPSWVCLASLPAISDNKYIVKTRTMNKTIQYKATDNHKTPTKHQLQKHKYT